jgi:hypothetical protein
MKEKLLYPVLVAVIIGILSGVASGVVVLIKMWSTQKVILEKIENVQKDTNQVVKWLDDHERDGH